MAIWASRTAVGRTPPDTADPAPAACQRERRLAANAFKTLGFIDFYPGEAGPDARCHAFQHGQLRDLHTVFGFGSSLVVCHGRGHEVQWGAENERRGWRAPVLRSRAFDSRLIRDDEPGGR